MNNGALQLIGWDDVLCRPIYRRCFAPTVATKKPRVQKKVAVRLTLADSPSLSFSHSSTSVKVKNSLSMGDGVVDDDLYDEHEEEAVERPTSRRTKRGAQTAEPRVKSRQNYGREHRVSSSVRNKPGSNKNHCVELVIDNDSSNDDTSSDVIADGGTFCLVDESESIASRSCGKQSESRGSIEIEETISREYNISNSLSDGASQDNVTDEKTEGIIYNQQPVGIQIIDLPSNTVYSDLISDRAPSINESPQNNDIRCNFWAEFQPNHTERELSGSVCCKRIDEHRDRMGNSAAKTVASPTATPMKQFVPRHMPASTCDYSSADKTTNVESTKRSSMHSPMMFEYDRASIAPSDADIDNMSLLSILDTEGKSCGFADNRRSYGQANKPNWKMKGTTEHKMNTLNTGMKKLIGWDDVNCRPIYRGPDRAPNLEKIELIDQDSSSEFVGDVSKLGRSQKRRAYFSSFRKSSAFKAARHYMDLDSPGARRVTLEKEDSSKDDVASTNSSDEGIADLALTFKLEPEATEYCDPSDPELCESQVVNAIQPNSKSSIESARAFFRYLDSNHRLVIAKKKDDSCTTRSNVIRTTRKILHSCGLRNEYDEYYQTVTAEGIDPISVDQFASHWNLYFTQTGIIRDGLLDED